MIYRKVPESNQGDPRNKPQLVCARNENGKHPLGSCWLSNVGTKETRTGLLSVRTQGNVLAVSHQLHFGTSLTDRGYEEVSLCDSTRAGEKQYGAWAFEGYTGFPLGFNASYAFLFNFNINSIHYIIPILDIS